MYFNERMPNLGSYKSMPMQKLLFLLPYEQFLCINWSNPVYIGGEPLTTPPPPPPLSLPSPFTTTKLLYALLTIFLCQGL